MFIILFIVQHEFLDISSVTSFLSYISLEIKSIDSFAGLFPVFYVSIAECWIAHPYFFNYTDFFYIRPCWVIFLTERRNGFECCKREMLSSYAADVPLWVSAELQSFAIVDGDKSLGHCPIILIRERAEPIFKWAAK